MSTTVLVERCSPLISSEPNAMWEAFAVLRLSERDWHMSMNLLTRICSVEDVGRVHARCRHGDE